MRRRIRLTSTRCSGDLLALDDDASPVDRLEQVHTAEQRRLARAGRADQADDVVLGDVQVDAAEHLQLPEGLVHTVEEQRFAHALDACRLRRSRSTSQSVNRASGIVERDEEQRGRDVRRVVERRRSVDLRLLERLHRAEEADERCVLLQPDEVVEERRDHPAHGLREHDRAERLKMRQPERARRRGLARVHGLDSGAIDLGHVRRVDEDERDDPPERRRERHVLQPQRRRAEAEHRDHEDRRHASEEVGVRDAEQAKRQGGRARQAADHGEHEREDEDERLRDQEDLDVEPERARDLGQRVLELTPVEERAPHLGPARRVSDQHGQQREEDDRAGGRDQRSATALGAGHHAAEDSRAAVLVQVATSGPARRRPSPATCPESAAAFRPT